MRLLARTIQMCIVFFVFQTSTWADPAELLAKEAAEHVVSCSALDDYKTRVHNAIYAALKYPAAMTFQAATGITTIKYKLFNGQPSGISVSRSSGNPILDRAATNAVKDAKYPLLPNSLVDVQIPDVVYIIFDNTGELQRQAKNTPSAENGKADGPDATPCLKSDP